MGHYIISRSGGSDDLWWRYFQMELGCADMSLPAKRRMSHYYDEYFIVSVK